MDASELDLYISWLRHDLMTFPQPRSLILAARYLLSEYDRSLIPDWIAALAGGEQMSANLVEEVFITLTADGGGNGYELRTN